MTTGHYDIEPETVVRSPGILRIYWVDPDTGSRSHLWNMAAGRLFLLGEAITAYEAAHPELAEPTPGGPAPDDNDQAIPLPRRQQ
jgi:hypothetical protein